MAWLCNQVIHYDLKPSNILIQGLKEIQILIVVLLFQLFFVCGSCESLELKKKPFFFAFNTGESGVRLLYECPSPEALNSSVQHTLCFKKCDSIHSCSNTFRLATVDQPNEFVRELEAKRNPVSSKVTMMTCISQILNANPLLSYCKFSLCNVASLLFYFPQK